MAACLSTISFITSFTNSLTISIIQATAIAALTLIGATSEHRGHGITGAEVHKRKRS